MVASKIVAVVIFTTERAVFIWSDSKIGGESRPHSPTIHQPSNPDAASSQRLPTIIFRDVCARGRQGCQNLANLFSIQAGSDPHHLYSKIQKQLLAVGVFILHCASPQWVDSYRRFGILACTTEAETHVTSFQRTAGYTFLLLEMLKKRRKKSWLISPWHFGVDIVEKRKT